MSKQPSTLTWIFSHHNACTINNNTPYVAANISLPTMHGNAAIVLAMPMYWQNPRRFTYWITWLISYIHGLSLDGQSYRPELATAQTLCFQSNYYHVRKVETCHQLGGAARRLSWEILLLGLCINNSSNSPPNAILEKKWTQIFDNSILEGEFLLEIRCMLFKATTAG